MDRAEQRQRLLVVGAVAAMVLLVGDKLILTPLTNAWKDRAERIKTLEAKVSKGLLVIERETTTRARWDKYKRRGLTADRAGSESKLIGMVGEWSDKSRFNITAVRPNWRDDAEDHARLQFRVAGDGNVESIARFLFHLDASDFGIRAESIEITARDKGGQKLGMDLQFSGLQIIEKEEPEKKEKL